MPMFIQLSDVNLNVVNIKEIVPTPKNPRETGCIVYFVDDMEPHLFYGKDADLLLKLVSENKFLDVRESTKASLVGAR